MTQQSARQAARRLALGAQAVLRKERANRERRLEASAAEVPSGGQFSVEMVRRSQKSPVQRASRWSN